MADSDEEYIEDVSDHDGTGTRSKDRKRTRDGKPKRNAAKWETFQQSWDTVHQNIDGTSSLAERLEAEKRRRLLRDTTPLQRGIIRHVMLVLDMSSAMTDKDLLPNRYRLTLNYAIEFVRVYFAQNPISQLGIIGMRDGVAVPVSNIGGNPDEHIVKLITWRDTSDPQGNPSLQNALEMCRGLLYGTPSHGTREVLIIYGALFTIDPGDIRDTIEKLKENRIRVSIVGLSAQVAICAELCSRTNDGDTGSYTVALHEQHFRELFLAATTPPITRTAEQDNPSLLMMGFPSRKLAPNGTLVLCACHNRPRRETYTCTRCRAPVCLLPIECPVCRLTLIQSTHLARSYHHLFPLGNWVEVPWAEAAKSACCYSCLALFPPPPANTINASSTALTGTGLNKTVPKGVSESGRYACRKCRNHFCVDCDVFAHEVVHECPGCESDKREAVLNEREGVLANAVEVNGSSAGHTNGGGAGGDQRMEID